MNKTLDEMTLKRGNNLMSFPILETERLILRQLRLEDAIELFDYFSKDEVTEFYDLDSFTDMKQAEELIEN
ncbi:hypothetical protein [Paenibacillus sp. SC116]|uniref:GNAT family N-acetyltransferase n=1 Tax=Paenibacillus sp. SC116 TaxID=2968986 RepID=UPI002811C2D0|nr:hypothetical protein [Paenibacillus sp. SC116]